MGGASLACRLAASEYSLPLPSSASASIAFPLALVGNQCDWIFFWNVKGGHSSKLKYLARVTRYGKIRKPQPTQFFSGLRMYEPVICPAGRTRAHPSSPRSKTCFACCFLPRSSRELLVGDPFLIDWKLRRGWKIVRTKFRT